MNQQGFKNFLKNIGLVNYPFNLYTAENEQEYQWKMSKIHRLGKCPGSILFQ